jgi:hypothetical protein
MSNVIHVEAAVSFIPATGIDLLGRDARVMGRATAIAVDDCGTASAAALDIPALGVNDGLGLIPRTGCAGDGADLLVGCGGIDMSFETAAIPATGRNVLFAPVTHGGNDVLGHSAALASTAVPHEVSVALMLHHSDIVAARVAVPVAVLTGCAG